MPNRRFLEFVCLATFFVLVSSLALASDKERRPGLFTARHEEPFDLGAVCSTNVEETLHLFQVPLGDRVTPRASAPAGNVDVGDIAVVEDDGSIVLNGNGPVDLQGFTLTFDPTSGGGMDVDLNGAPSMPATGDVLVLEDDDFALVSFKGFSFPFFGTDFDEVFVNSNGYLTFTTPDPFGGSPEGFFRIPRIAGLASDLNPAAGGEVSVLHESKRTTFLWDAVPEPGFPGVNTFFITLHKSGRIEIGFVEVASLFAPTGVTPGGLRPGLTQVDYTEDAPLDDVRGAVFEIFFPEGTKQLDLASLTQSFYDTHADEYDVVVLWSDFAFDIRAGFAFYQFLQNEVRGIGLRNLVGVDVFDQSLIYGSNGALKGFLNMNFLDLYPDDPQEPFLRTNTTLSIMGQEAGHRFGAFVNFDSDPGPDVVPSIDLLGRSLAHWSSLADTDASHLEGNAWEEVAPGEFEVTEATQRFSPLDEYLIGLRPPEEVPPFWYIADDPLFSGTISNIERAQVFPPPLPEVDILLDDAQDFGPAGQLFTNFSFTFLLATNPGTPREAPALVLQNGITADGPNSGALTVFSFFGPLAGVAAPGDPYEVTIDPSAPPQTNLFNGATGQFDGPPFFAKGQRRDVTIEDVIAAEGRRLPVAGAQPREFRQAFILLTEKGTEPDAGRLAKLERIRSEWVEEYDEATGGLGETVTTLVPRGKARIASVAGRAKGSRSTVETFDTAGESVASLRPFSSTNPFSVAAASLGGERDYIVVGSAGGRRGQIRIMHGDGTSAGISFTAFDRKFKDGVHVAAGDLDGDGRDEIVAAMADKGTRVRVFNAKGRPTGVDFEAFGDGRKKGKGVHVATGDLDGDGRDEIVVSTGKEDNPRVRVFSGDGTFTGVDFEPLDKSKKDGVAVAVGDLDGDGRAEILVAPMAKHDTRIIVFDAEGNPLGHEIVPQAVLDRRGDAKELSMVAADVDLDGMDEIVIAASQGNRAAFAIYEGDGSLIGGPFALGVSKDGGDDDKSDKGKKAIAIAAGDF